MIYKFDCLLQAVDIAFKACFVFNVHYAACAKSTWLFLQRIIYDIETVHDDLSKKLHGLIIDTKKQLRAK
jgi:hypothetical protein